MKVFSPIMFLEEFRSSIPELMLSEIRLLFITLSCESRRAMPKRFDANILSEIRLLCDEESSSPIELDVSVLPNILLPFDM